LGSSTMISVWLRDGNGSAAHRPIHEIPPAQRFFAVDLSR
jgi:hypothetical protein